MPIVLKSGSLNFLEPSGPVKACNGIALPFTTNKCCKIKLKEYLTPVRFSALQIHTRRRTTECDIRRDARCQVEFWIWAPPFPFDFDRPGVDIKGFFLLAPLLLVAVFRHTSKPSLFATSRDDLTKYQHVTRLPLPPLREIVDKFQPHVCSFRPNGMKRPGVQTHAWASLNYRCANQFHCVVPRAVNSNA